MRHSKMVVTRRGTRVSSAEGQKEAETTKPASPTTSRRRRTVIVTEQSQSEQSSNSQQNNAEEQNTIPAEPAKTPARETRRSKHQTSAANQPDSIHEADVSESESCCSVVSDVLVQSVTRSRRRVAGRKVPVAEQGSEGESCSSAPPSKPQRSTRSHKKTASVLVESATSQDHDQSEAESCSSAVSVSNVILTPMITRNRRRTAVLPEIADPSEVDSCSSAVSSQQSAVRRSMRKTKSTKPITINLDESESTEASAFSAAKRTRGRKVKVKSAEDQIYDSEGCHSGPSRSPWRMTGVCVIDSDSESNCISLDSSCSPKVVLTPCSSRTGSASSSRAGPTARTRSKVSVTHVSSDVSKGEKLISKEGEHVNEQTEIPVDTTCQSANAAASDSEDVKEMDEEQINRTVISAEGQEFSNLEDGDGDLTLTLDENSSSAETKMLESKSQQSVGVSVSENNEKMNENLSAKEQVETEKCDEIMVCEKIPEPLQDQPNLMAEHNTEGQAAESVKVVVESEEVGESEDVLDVADTVSASQTSVIFSDFAHQKMEQVVEVDKSGDMNAECCVSKQQNVDLSTSVMEEGPSSSKAQTKPGNVVTCLLDSSEDEDSDGEGLSDESCREDAGHDDSEKEVMCSVANRPGSSKEQDSAPDNDLFVIDRRPGVQPSEKYYIKTTSHKEDDGEDSKAVEDEDEFVDEEVDDEEDDAKALFATRKPAMMKLSSSIDPGLKVKQLGGLYISFDGTKSKSVSNNLKKLKDQKNQDELMKKSVIVADFEKKDAVPPYKESKHAAKLKRREERSKTTGDAWFNMKAPELTEELKNDLKVLKMRSAMDPKRFYKKNDREGFPKYFQVGTVVDNPADFYHSRVPKKQRKRTIVEELLADAEFRSFNKRKYQEIMTENAAAAAGRKNKKHTFNKKK